MVLDRDAVVGIVAHGRAGKPPRRIAPRLDGLVDLEGLLTPRMQVGRKALGPIFNVDEHRREARGVLILGHDQRDRLEVEMNLVVIERTIGRAALRRDVIAVVLVLVGHLDPVGVGQHVDDAIDGKGATAIDPDDAPLGDGGVDDDAEGEIGRGELSSVFRCTDDLGAAVDAGG